MIDDASLLLAIAERRDSEAFGQLYERYATTACNLARHLTGNPDRAAEAVQEAMLRVWSRALNFRPDGNARGWILRIVARESLRLARKRRVESAEVNHDMEIPAQEEQDPAGSIEQLVKREELVALRHSVERLPARYRQIVALYYGAGLSQREIGEELDVSQKTISALLDEALRRLRSMLAKAGVAATAPLLDTNVLFSALSTGHIPPVELGPSIFARLADPATPKGLANRGLSGRAAVNSGSVLWIVGLVVVVAGGARWALWTPNAQDTSGRASEAAEAEPKAPAVASQENSNPETGVLGHWTFDKGPPEDFEVVRGGWNWQAPLDGKPGCMRASGRVFVLAPVLMPDMPVRVTCRFSPAQKNNTIQLSVLRTNGKKIPAFTYWKARPVVRPLEEYMHQMYLLHRYTVGRLVGDQQISVAEYGENPPLGPLCFDFTNMDIREIEIRALAMEEIPKDLQDAKAAIERTDSTPVDLGETPLRGATEK